MATTTQDMALTKQQFFDNYVRVVGKRLQSLNDNDPLNLEKQLKQRFTVLKDKGLQRFPQDSEDLMVDSVSLAQPSMAPTGSCTYTVNTGPQGIQTFCIDAVTQAECTDLGSQLWTQNGTCLVTKIWRQ